MSWGLPAQVRILFTALTFILIEFHVTCYNISWLNLLHTNVTYLATFGNVKQNTLSLESPGRKILSCLTRVLILCRFALSGHLARLYCKVVHIY
jgi:hypothetical protein